MEKNVYKEIAKLYHNRDLNVLSHLSEKHGEALKLHWAGQFKESLETYIEFLGDYTLGSDKVLDLALADCILLSVKMGQAFDTELDISKASTLDAQIIMFYAKFYWAFWVDHKIAIKALKKIVAKSLFSNCPQFMLTGIFLFFHLKTIAGGNLIPFNMTRLIYLIFKWDQLRGGRFPHLSRNVVFASFPYTQFVAGRIGVKDIETSISFAEKYVVNDPFYNSLVLISGFYGYAYSGNVARTEIFAERFRSLQKMGKLTRYEPVTVVMRFLPHALRGYGYLIAERFWNVLEAHRPSQYDPLINSQFYRASSVIALVLGNNERAHQLITLARHERKKTASFTAWEKIDERIEALSGRSTPFDPSQDKIANIEVNFSQPPQLSSILIELISATPSALNKTEDEYINLITKIVTKHLDCPSFELSKNVGLKPSKNPQILICGRILEFTQLEPGRVDYIKELASALNPMIDHVIEIYQDLVKAQKVQKEAVLVDLATETAHNILGSVDDLDSDTENLKFLDEEHKRRHERLIARIQTVANELLLKKRQILLSKSKQIKDSTDFAYSLKPELLTSIVDNVVKERRTTTSKGSVNINWKPNPFHYSLFCSIHSIELEVALANIIDNAIDSIIEANAEDKTVAVKVDLRNGSAFISVTDYGTGISPEIIDRVTEKNFTTKPSGNGLGLYHVYHHTQKWGGDLSIESYEGFTKVILKIPICTPPEWFAPLVSIPKNGTVVVFDDDDGIHFTWQKRLKEFGYYTNSGNIVSCKTPDELKTEIESLKAKKKAFVLLSDYEIYGERVTGLELIEQLGVAEHSYIVSSYYREDFVTQPCQKKGIQIVPKNLARFARIYVEDGQLDAIQIEDDDFVRSRWKDSAKAHRKRFLSFYSVSEALSSIKLFPKNIPIFVDSNLGSEQGEESSKQMFDLGYNNIWLSTASSKTLYQELARPHIIDVIGKLPPWEKLN